MSRVMFFAQIYSFISKFNLNFNNLNLIYYHSLYTFDDAVSVFNEAIHDTINKIVP